MSYLQDAIIGRKSVRAFDGRKLTDEDRNKLIECSKSIKNPFGIDVEFKFLDGEEFGLSSPVLTGEKEYVTGITNKDPYADVAFGYSFEQLVIYAWSLGIGTVWIGGTMKREDFESAAGLAEGQRMPCVSPLGYPSSKRSVKEILMRKGVKADSRKPYNELFFDENLDTPLEADAEIRRILELVRWAPSAVNKQPWRIIRKDGVYHFYKKADKGFENESVGDMQRIDMGIALCHFVLCSEDAGIRTEVVVEDPSIEVTADMQYIASVKILSE